MILLQYYKHEDAFFNINKDINDNIIMTIINTLHKYLDIIIIVLRNITKA